jgi:hypothetical protein
MSENVSSTSEQPVFSRDVFLVGVFFVSKTCFENNKADQILIGFVVLLNILKISDNEYLKGFTAGLVESATQVSWRARAENQR